MEYYYDIYLNFYDYPLNYYEWDDDDALERIMKIPLIRINNIKDLIAYNIRIDCEYDYLLVSDGINALALEIIDSEIAYLSFLSYDDEFNVNAIARTLPLTNLKITKLSKRHIPHHNRQDEINKKIILKSIENLNPDLLKYLYYYLFHKESNNISKICEKITKDIETNYNDKYEKIIPIICQQ